MIIAAFLLLQSVRITAPATIAVYDTVPVTGYALDATARRSTASTVRWSWTPSVNVLPDSATRGQTVRVVGVTRGPATLVATWARSDGRTIRDSAQIEVIAPRVVKVALYTGFQRLGTQVFGVWPVSWASAVRRCVYVVAYDKEGWPVTGKRPEINIEKPAVAIEGGFSGLCADTTVDPAKVVP